MFTGIVQATAPITAIEEKDHFRTHHVCLPDYLMLDLTISASMAHNGCCLTVTGINDNVVSFDLMKETLRLTNLGELKVGDEVNLERAASMKTEIGGHLMSGHIICTATLIKIVKSENNRQIWFFIPEKTLMKYILYKGYIGVDGISLTVGEVADNCFCVYLIPETLLRTTLGKKRLRDSVNIEIDAQTQAIVNTVERVLTSGVCSLTQLSC
ncbi:riboflavin synthase subunit alpha [Sodalis endosymbiont of Henestaris halophilus]|uniref:riboflavin synthase subunit alpha n=1 Tax=Sodalis endosymbiont of Henestaris halophilus TaxID=1929246 RepID=UPI000BBF5D65|nr:riboflavin synthase subunit alpha [Sodalis endosymbiont of Henestaris halophilus]SNC58800.1 Riboflavin synthase [Sodalis endosymbiont of Henestaris halophilus]